MAPMIAIESALINKVGGIEAIGWMTSEAVFFPLSGFRNAVPLEVIAGAARLILYGYFF
jgi:hypothetical protein